MTGWIVRVVTKDGDYWLGQRIYLSIESARTVRRNKMDGNRAGRYLRIYIVPATEEQFNTALSIVE